MPAPIRTFTAWTRSGTLRFRWSGLPVWSDRLITASLADRPDAPGAPLTLRPRLRCGDVASPLHAARRLAECHQLGEPVRRVEEVVGKATDQNPIKKPASLASPLASPLAR